MSAVVAIQPCRGVLHALTLEARVDRRRGHRTGGAHRRDRALRRGPRDRTDREEALMDQLKHLIDLWTSYAQGLTGSIGALAFVCAFIWKMVAIEPRSVMEAKRWIGRIVFGTLGVEMAGLLVRVLVDSVNH